MEKSTALQPVVGNTTPVTFNFFDKDQFDVMQRVSKMFANSELVPDMYKINMTLKDNQPINPPERAMSNCMIAIEMAQRIGASPLMVMQNMVIIYGRPSWSSKFLVATVNTCGRFNPLQYRFTNLGMVGKISLTEYEWNPQTKRKEAVKKEFDGTKIENWQCVAFTTAKGSAEILESSPIDIKLAIQEGWYTKAGSKWQTMTRQMLMYRAASFWTSAYAPELSMGMKTEEEVRDYADVIDIPHEDVSVKIGREMAENANKTVITMEEKKVDHPEPKAPEKKETEAPKAPEQTVPKAPEQPAQQAPSNLFPNQNRQTGPGF